MSQLARKLSSATASLAFMFVYPSADLIEISLQFTNTKQTPIRSVSWSSVNDSKSPNVHKHEVRTSHGSVRSRHFLATRMTAVYFIVFCIKNTPYETFSELTRSHTYQRCINVDGKCSRGLNNALTYLSASVIGSIVFSLSAQLNRVALNWCRKNIMFYFRQQSIMVYLVNYECR